MIIYQPDRVLIREFVAKHASKFSGTVLDVGGANRRYAHFFKHCKYLVMDINLDLNPDIISNIESIELDNNSIDGIICTQVLGDVWDLKSAIDEMARILRPEGFLLISESLLNEEHDEPNDYWRLTRFAWEKILDEKYNIEVLESRGGFHSQIAQQKIRFAIEKYNLYERKIIGRIAHLWASIIGKLAIKRDKWNKSKENKKFPIGYCILAKKK